MQTTSGEKTETIEAVRFLWAMVGVSAGVVELLECRIEAAGEQITCRNRTTKAVFTVSRTSKWTDDEERFYAAELDRALAGHDDADPVGEIIGVAQHEDLVLAGAY